MLEIGTQTRIYVPLGCRFEKMPWPKEVDSWEALSWHWKPTDIEGDNWERESREMGQRNHSGFGTQKAGCCREAESM